MITTQKYNTLESSGIQDSVSFGIKGAGLVHIFGILRNQLYTDKIGAIIREISSNAKDANTEANKASVPIKVTLPSTLDKTLKIRDYGRGLTQQDIQEVFCYYGESTKRQSNAYIGQLGLGSKSPFSYTDSFLINSFVDGTVSTYNAFIDPSGIGQIALLSTSATDEPNGVEICVPVKESDCREFAKSAIKYLRFFNPQPEIFGLTQEELDNMFAPPIASGDKWALYKNITRPTAIMGNIGYPIEVSVMKLDYRNNPEERKIYNLLTSSPICLSFDIGDLDVAASREGLQYTEKTITNIKTLALATANRIIEEIEIKINKEAKSIYSAKKVLSSMDDLISGFNTFRRLMDKITFQGVAINHSRIDVDKISKDELVSFDLMRYQAEYNGNISAKRNFSFEAREGITLVLNDLGAYQSGARRARHLANETDNRVYLFTPLVTVDNQNKPIKTADLPTYATQLQEITEANGFCDADFVLASSITLPPHATPVNRSVRTGVLEFSYYKTYNTSRPDNRKSWNQTVVDMKNGKGVYVVVNNYQAFITDGVTKTSSSELNSFLQSFPILSKTQIIGVTRSQEKKLGAGWVKLLDAARIEFKDFIKTNKISLDRVQANKMIAKASYDSPIAKLTSPDIQRNLIKGIKSPHTVKVLSTIYDAINNRLGGTIDINAFSNMEGYLYAYDRTITNTINPDNVKKITDKAIEGATKLCSDYPLLTVIQWDSLRYAGPQVIDSLASYLNKN